MSLCWLRGLVVLRSWRTSALACSFVFESWSVWSVEILFLFAEGEHQKTDRVLLDTLKIGGVIRLFSMWSVRLSARRLCFSGLFLIYFAFGSLSSLLLDRYRSPPWLDIVPPAGHQCVQLLFVESPLATSCKFSIGIFLTFALL